MLYFYICVIIPLAVTSQLAPAQAPSVSPPVAVVPTFQVPTVGVPTFQVPTFFIPTAPTFFIPTVPTIPVFTLAPTPRAPSSATQQPTPSDYGVPSELTIAPTPTVLLLPQRSLPPTEEPTEEPTSSPSQSPPFWTVVDTVIITSVLGLFITGGVIYYAYNHFLGAQDKDDSLSKSKTYVGDESITESTPLYVGSGVRGTARPVTVASAAPLGSGDDYDEQNLSYESGAESSSDQRGDSMYYGLYMASTSDNDLPQEDYSDYEN